MKRSDRSKAKIMRLLINFTIFLFMAACSSNVSQIHEDCVEKINPDCCICTEEYRPVCGCNGKTYGNGCTAECSGIEHYTSGECKK